MYSKTNLIDDNTPTDPESIFQKGSTTYYHSTKLFSTKIRKDVTTLYCFVRVVDDFVDAVPQDLESFNNFKNDYHKALSGKEVNNSIISNYIELSYRKGFEAEWTDAFLKSMEMDTYKSEYNDLGELNDYLYGSSEVIGLMMNKVMDIDERAHDSARYLGKAMQFINFIRDIDEDLDLNRTYFPKDTLAKFGLNGLTRGEARRKPKQFKAFVRSQIKVYFDWQKKAETGFIYLPKRMRVAVKTASDMYMWTATKIYKNPFLVYDIQIKPTWNKVLLAGIKNYFSIYLSFNNKNTSIQEPLINNTRTV
jgi:phytoene synthase